MNFSSPDFLKDIRAREASAVKELVHAYTEHLYRGALGIGFDAHMASDLVQNVWVTFFDVVHNFRGDSHIRTFLFGILYNKASELRRENKKFDTKDPVEELIDKHFDSAGQWINPPINPEQFMIGAEIMDLIQKCLDSLPLTQRMAFCLKEIDEHGSSDICKIMDVSVTNLGVLLFRARNRLRECIEGKAKQAPKKA